MLAEVWRKAGFEIVSILVMWLLLGIVLLRFRRKHTPHLTIGELVRQMLQRMFPSTTREVTVAFLGTAGLLAFVAWQFERRGLESGFAAGLGLELVGATITYWYLSFAAMRSEAEDVEQVHLREQEQQRLEHMESMLAEIWAELLAERTAERLETLVEQPADDGETQHTGPLASVRRASFAGSIASYNGTHTK